MNGGVLAGGIMAGVGPHEVPGGEPGRIGGGVNRAEDSGPSGSEGAAGASERYSGRYPDGQKAYRTNVPRDPDTNVPEPHPDAQGPHSRLQADARDPSRVYSATEFDENGNPLNRVDFAGRRGDPVPHEHRYDPATKAFGDKHPLNVGSVHPQ